MLVRTRSKTVTRADRLARAPRVPDAQTLRYLRLTAQIETRIEGWAQTLLGPVADAQGSVRRDMVSSDFEDAFAQLNAQLYGMLGSKELGAAIHNIGSGVVAHSTKENSRSLGIDLRGSEGHLDSYVQSFVQRNVLLIRSVSADQLGRMREIVNTYHAGQENQRSLRDQLMDTFGLSRARASLIARDQTLKANADITRLQQTQVGVSEYDWTTAGDERVRGRPGGKWANSAGDHWVLDGTRQSWLTAGPIVDGSTGRREHPGKDFQCRCVPVPVVDHLLGRR
jgi:uncharacterized protein with gpF-like domain